MKGPINHANYQSDNLFFSCLSYLRVIFYESLVLYCASLLRTIFASLAHAHERMRVQTVRDFPQTKLDSGINAPFLLIKGPVIRATFLSRNIVALQVAKLCCPYYHPHKQFVAQRISASQVAATCCTK